MNVPRMAARILNVDDNEIGRYTKSRILQQAGFEVIEAASGSEAMQLIQTQRPHLVLLDLQLPDMSGFEICRRLKTDPQTQRLPVLHITATGNATESELNSIESGADIFLAQPVEPLELITVVQTLLKLRSTEIGLAASEERMRLATEGAGIATWDIDLRDRSAHFTPRLYELLGLAAQTAPTLDAWQSRMHADDRDAFASAIRHAAASGGLLSVEHRIPRPGGADRWLSVYGKVHVDDGGNATRMMGVVGDITARKRAEMYREELLRLEQVARAEAENVVRLKDEFLATLSHELRSPMSAILGWLALMRSGRLTPEQQRQAIDTIERNAQLQNQLINDLLDVSRVVTGKLELEREALLMHELLREAIDSVRTAADAKKISIAADIEPIGPLYFDASRLQQVFGNLLSNALKFTPERGRIEVASRRNGDFYEVEVSDNGEGIAQEALPYLFERFRQADGSTTRRHGGLGLGLAIVRHLVELHGGGVSARSAGPGAGSTFVVRLPVAAAPPAGDSAGDQPQSARRASTRHALKGLRVLVTDDEASARGLMSHVLAAQGADVVTASSAKEALAAYAESSPSVLVLDIGMPDEDGYELLRKLREQAKSGAAIPAIAVTGYAQQSDRERAFAAGFQAHITKPFDIDEIVRVVATVAQSSE